MSKGGIQSGVNMNAMLWVLVNLLRFGSGSKPAPGCMDPGLRGSGIGAAQLYAAP